MANYYATILTNYFSVTDEERFREIIASCASEDDIEIFENVDNNGSKKLGFGCYGTIYGIGSSVDEEENNDGDNGDDNGDGADLEAFYAELQSVLCEGDAILITEIGREKLNYVIGECIVITSGDMKTISIWNEAIKLAKDMLGNEEFDTKYSY